MTLFKCFANPLPIYRIIQ